jgi:inosine-uridine nucleoside N-ribohydrolase
MDKTLLEYVRNALLNSRPGVPNIVLNDDISHNDTDGDFALLTAIKLHLQGKINLVAVIMNTLPVMRRARIARGLLNMYGLHSIPVGAGDDAMEKMQQCDEPRLIPYYTEDSDSTIFNGDELMKTTLELFPEKSLRVVANGPLADMENWLKRFTELFQKKVEMSVIMGGVESYLDSQGRIVPNATKDDNAPGAMNNVFNRNAARYVYPALQDLGIPMKIVTRSAVFSVMQGKSICGEIPMIGESLMNRVIETTQRFWEDCCFLRITPDRDRAWYVKYILQGNDPPIADGEPIEPFAGKSLPLYDMITVMVASDFGTEYLNPEIVTVNGVDHYIIGRSDANNGVSDPSGFSKLMKWILTK